MTNHPRKLRGVAIATVAAAALLVLPVTAPARDTLGACGRGAGLLAFSDALSKTTFDGFGVGGLSALALRGGDHHARALVDNHGATAARYYDLDLDAHGDLAPAVQAVTTLHRVRAPAAGHWPTSTSRAFGTNVTAPGTHANPLLDNIRPRRRPWAARPVPDLRRQLRGGPGHPRL